MPSNILLLVISNPFLLPFLSLRKCSQNLPHGFLFFRYCCSLPSLSCSSMKQQTADTVSTKQPVCKKLTIQEQELLPTFFKNSLSMIHCFILCLKHVSLTLIIFYLSLINSNTKVVAILQMIMYIKYYKAIISKGQTLFFPLIRIQDFQQ